MACQMQTGGVPQQDTYKEPVLAKSVNKPSDLNEKSVKELMERQKEIEKELANADEVPSSKSMDACEQAKDGKTVGKGNAKRRKTPKKKGKTEEKCKKMI